MQNILSQGHAFFQDPMPARSDERLLKGPPRSRPSTCGDMCVCMLQWLRIVVRASQDIVLDLSFLVLMRDCALEGAEPQTVQVVCVVEPWVTPETGLYSFKRGKRHSLKRAVRGRV